MSEKITQLLTRGNVTIPTTLIGVAFAIGTQIHNMHIEAVAAIKANEAAVVRMTDELKEVRHAIEYKRVADVVK